MNRGIALIKIGSLYLAGGLALGLGMAITKNLALTTVHAHLTLLGWGAMAPAGLVYLVCPRLAETRLARLHFWLHNAGLPVMMISLGFHSYGFAAAEPYLGLGSVLVVIGLGCFAANLLRLTEADTTR